MGGIAREDCGMGSSSRVIAGLVLMTALFAGCGSMPPAQDKVQPTQEENITAPGDAKVGKPDGQFTMWHDNGEKEAEVTYKDGKVDGLVTIWHENGQKAEELTFKDGVRISRSHFSYEWSG
jgi:hypothetical protein